MLPICLSSSLFFFFSSLLLLASPVIARTTGFRTYDTLVPGEDTVFTITTSSYNSVVYDEVMLFGLSSASEWRKGDLGYPFVSTKILGPDLSNNLINMTHYVQIPIGTYITGPAVLSAALVSRYNITNTPIITYYYANVTITKDRGAFLGRVTESREYFLPSPCGKKY